MRRKAFDILVSAGGVVMVVTLLVAGALGMWGYRFTNASVHNQLAQQKIFFPPQTAFAHAQPGTQITPSMIPSVSQYAGQQLLTGKQAKVYADEFVAVHLSEMPFHGVYAQISNAANAQPQNAALQTLKATSFQGTTLRGLLLEAYAFSVFGMIAFWASIASFILAAVMALLVLLGLRHARQVPQDAELLGDEPRAGVR